jgi:hypothetical protein
MTDLKEGRNNSESVLKLTKCPNELKCLSDISYPRCRVRYAIGAEPALFVYRPQNDPCRYCIPFGDSHLCSCPVHRELHAKYRI